MDTQWTYIVDKILNDQCVIICGPQLIPSETDHGTVQKDLEVFLDIENNPNIFRYYPKDGFFLFDQSYKRTLVCHQVKEFYKKKDYVEDYRLLSEIPFHIYLSVTPDKLLCKCFDDQGYNYQYGYYKKHTCAAKIRNPTSDNPLIYNAFGSINSEESLILNHDDLFDYFKSIFARSSMPELLKIKLKEARNIVFLGLEFDKWYMQLLLRELEFHKQEYQITKFAAGATASYDVEVFCKDQFSVHFVNNNISEFISDLHSRIPANKLRKSSISPKLELLSLKDMIGEGNLEACIEQLKLVTFNTKYDDDAYLISSKFRKLNRRSMHQLIEPDKIVVQESKLIKSVLSLITEMQSSGLWN